MEQFTLGLVIGLPLGVAVTIFSVWLVGAIHIVRQSRPNLDLTAASLRRDDAVQRKITG